MRAGLGRRDSDRSGKRRERKRDPIAEADAPRLDVRDSQPGVRVFIREEPELRNDRGPSPLRRLEFENLHGEHVAWLGSSYVHRAANRIHVLEVELRDVACVRVATDLLVGRVSDVKLDGLARSDLERRVDRVVPDVRIRVGPNAVNRVAASLHGEIEHYSVCQIHQPYASCELHEANNSSALTTTVFVPSSETLTGAVIELRKFAVVPAQALEKPELFHIERLRLRHRSDARMHGFTLRQ